MDISIEDLIKENIAHHKGMIANAKRNRVKFHLSAIKVYPLLKKLGFSKDSTIDTILEEFDFESPNSVLTELINVLSETKLIEKSSYWIDGDRVYEEEKKARSKSVELGINTIKDIDFEVTSYKWDESRNLADVDIIWAKYMGLNSDGTCEQEVKEEVAKIVKLSNNPSLWVSNQGFFSRYRCNLISWSKLNY